MHVRDQLIRGAAVRIGHPENDVEELESVSHSLELTLTCRENRLEGSSNLWGQRRSQTITKSVALVTACLYARALGGRANGT